MQFGSLRKNDGGPPPLRSKNFLDGLPSLNPSQLAQVEESKEIHRRSGILCIAVFQQGGFAAQEQPLNSLAWKEPSHQQFLSQCSCHFVATPACKWGLDIFKTWAIAATSDRISTLAGHCKHSDHMDFRGKRLPDGSFVSSITAEYPSSLELQQSSTFYAPGLPNPIPSTSTLLNGGICSPRTPLHEVLASKMEQVTIAQQIGQFPCPMIISNHSVNGGSNASSSPNFITDSWKLPKLIQQNHLSPKRNSPLFFRTSETPSHQSQLMIPYYRINPSDFIFFTLSCYSPRTLTRILLYFFKKEYPQVLFLRSNQQVFGHPIPNHLITSQIFKFAKIIGAVRTKTLQPRLCSYKMRLKMDSSRRFQIYNPLKLVGLLVLLLENSAWSTLTTEILDWSLTPQSVG